MEAGDHVSELNIFASRTGSFVKYEDFGSVGPCHMTTFTQRVVVNGQAYPAGEGRTRKEAKQNAAKHAIKGLWEKAGQDRANSTVDENYKATSSKELVLKLCNKIQDLSVKPKGRAVKETNYIGFVEHYCLKKKLIYNHIELERRGQFHNHVFVYKLVINNVDYPTGEGKTVKEAKQHAAKVAWSALQEQSDWDSQVSIRSTVSEDGSLNRSRGSVDRSSQIMATSTSDSIRSTDSSNSSKDQDAVKDKNMGSSPNAKTSTLPGRFMSDFDSMERLGKGGFGCVYKVREKMLEKNYAVKIVNCEEKALKEVKALSDLHHANIVRYYSCWMEDSSPQEEHMNGDSATGSTSQSSSSSSSQYLYIQMELCDSKTLKVWIDGKNDEGTAQDSRRRDESLIIAQQIVSGIEYIHSMKLIHRDLKPDNIMFGMNGEVKIGDFGLVTADNDNDANHIERTLCHGTSSYMAPEQMSETAYDRKVDIFALGLIYFELLWTLYTCHEKKDEFQIWDEVRSQKLPAEFALKCPREDTIIKSMLRVKPEDRPEASEVKTELENYARTLR